MIPIVDGKHESFAAGGLYNGLVLLRDKTTQSYWDHITGECVYGEREGEQLEFTDFDLIYTTVEAALRMYPQSQLATSNHLNILGRFMQFMTPFMHRVLGNNLPPHFVKTVGEADTRRERMDLGLGVWSDRTRRYYPMEVIQASESGILDHIDGETIFVYYNQIAKAPDAVYVQAMTVDKQGDDYVFDGERVLQDGILYDANGHKLETRRSQQMFTRWYGFSYTFPNCEIYEGETETLAVS